MSDVIDGKNAEVGQVAMADIATMTGLEFMQGLVERKLPAPSISRTLNFGATQAERGSVTFTGTPTAEHLNPMGTVHGGWVSALMDSALGCAGQTLCEKGYASTSVDLKVNFVRPITPAVGRLICEANVVHPGRTLVTVDARVVGENDGKLYAHGSQVVMIFKLPTAG